MKQYSKMMNFSFNELQSGLAADEIAAWAAVFALIVAIVAIAISICQTRVQNRYIKAQVSADLTAKLNETNAVEIEHPEIPALYSVKEIPKTPEGHKLEVLTDMRMALLEEAFVQYRKFKLLDDKDWAAWEAILKRWTKRRFFRHTGRTLARRFESSLAKWLIPW